MKEGEIITIETLTIDEAEQQTIKLIKEGYKVCKKVKIVWSLKKFTYVHRFQMKFIGIKKEVTIIDVMDKAMEVIPNVFAAMNKIKAKRREAKINQWLSEQTQANNYQ